MFKWLREHSRWVLNNRGFWQAFFAKILEQQLKKSVAQTTKGTLEDLAPVDLLGAVKSAVAADVQAGIKGGEAGAIKGTALEAPTGTTPPPSGISGDIVTTGPGGRPIIGAGEATPSMKPSRLATPYESQVNLGKIPIPSPQTGLPPPQQAPQLNRYNIPEAFGRSFVGMPMEKPKMGWEAYTGAFIPDVLRSKLGLSTVGGRQYKQTLQDYYKQAVPVVDEYGREIKDPTTGQPMMTSPKRLKVTTPKETATEKFRTSLQQAEEAMVKGENSELVFKKMLQMYPDKKKAIEDWYYSLQIGP